MTDESNLRERRKVRRAARRKAYDVVESSPTLEEALAKGEVAMQNEYGSTIFISIAIFIITEIIKYLWSTREETGVLGELPPNWEARFDPE